MELCFSCMKEVENKEIIEIYCFKCIKLKHDKIIIRRLRMFGNPWNQIVVYMKNKVKVKTLYTQCVLKEQEITFDDMMKLFNH